MCRRLFLLAVLLPLASCSARQVYSGLQERERNLCAQGPPQEYQACIERIDMSYEEYRKRSPAPEGAGD